jgi:toxin ParE1/3/4
MARLYKVIWTPAAQRDLEAVTHFISAESPQTAVKIFRSIRLKAALLYRFPQRGRLIPELAHIPGLPFRELVLKPWRLFYRIKEDRIEVLAFLDGRRDLSEVLFERLSRVT